SRILKAKKDNIDIFSVITKQLRPPITDIRFSAHGSPYYKSVFLDGTVALNRDAIANEVGINITMVGIDECLVEGLHCDGSCTNKLEISRSPVVINANRTAFVGVNAWISPQCTCGARNFSKIETCRSEPSPCLNGGRCTDSSVGAICTCPPGFDGPQCQQTTRTFRDTKGWAWFPPLQQCEESHLSVEIMTQTATGLIFYNGPIVRPDPGVQVYSDFISLELFNGKPRLLIDFGSGATEVIVNTLGDLHDGEWHKLDIYWNKEYVRLMVDNCQGAEMDDRDPPRIDRSRCENGTQIPPFNEYLNVNGPLQLGGVVPLPKNELSLDLYFGWRYTHTKTGFVGCIKNFIHNSFMYDLGSPGSHKYSTAGCEASELSCDSNQITRRCVNGTCLGSYHTAKCICNPGWHGPRCDKETQAKMFQQSSYIKYALSFDPNPYKTDIQLMFRTRQKHGELFRVASKHGREYCILEIKDKKLRFRFNLNSMKSSEEHELWLPYVSVSDGQWHTVHVMRFGSTASIAVDGGGGRRYNELIDYEGLHQLMTVEKQNVIAGGDVQYVGLGATVVDNDFQEGCMNDIRLDQRYLPMENGSENAAVVEWRNLIEKCPSNNPCQGVKCSRPFECVDLWMHSECSCPFGLEMNGNRTGCVDRNECLWQPCGFEGVCHNLHDGEGFLCECKEFTCQNCTCDAGFRERKNELSIGLGGGAIAVILSCFIVYLCKTARILFLFAFNVLSLKTWFASNSMFSISVLVLVIIVYSRSRRPDQKCRHGDVDDDVRENIINYDDEGGGEDDMTAYDIGPLRIPIDATGTPIVGKGLPDKTLKDSRQRQHPGPHPDIGEFIREHLDKVDTDPNAPPFDDLRNYAYEGCGSTAGSLSSLASGTDDNEQDFDYLNGWGPRFQKLADMYQQGESEDE
ncbi:Neural-cadherin-like protein, partial [Leptotrombidium deliense]